MALLETLTGKVIDAIPIGVEFADADRERLLREIESLRGQLALFNWQPSERGSVQPQTLESAVIGWRNRCLAAEKKLENALADLGAVRSQVVEAGLSGVGRI